MCVCVLCQYDFSICCSVSSVNLNISFKACRSLAVYAGNGASVIYVDISSFASVPIFVIFTDVFKPFLLEKLRVSHLLCLIHIKVILLMGVRFFLILFPIIVFWVFCCAL